MNKNLIAVGIQSGKMELFDRRTQRKIMTFLDEAANGKFDSVTAIIRTQRSKDGYLSAMANDGIAADANEVIPYEATQVICVPGFDVDATQFRLGEKYYIMGISTSASVLCIALSMFSAGLDVYVIEDMCRDRKGDKYHKYAIEILKAYMPGRVV